MLALKHQNLLNPGILSAWTLEWTDEVNLIVECHLFDPDNTFLLVRSRYGDRPPQVLRLVGGASQSRWYLICPFTGGRLAKAFFRDGLFGSAKGNRLIHRSQRMAVIPEEAV